MKWTAGCHFILILKQGLSLIIQGECFAFLDTSSASKLEIMKCRTTFYKAITRLLVADLGEDEERFDAFMKPLRSLFIAFKLSMDPVIMP